MPADVHNILQLDSRNYVCVSIFSGAISLDPCILIFPARVV